MALLSKYTDKLIEKLGTGAKYERFNKVIDLAFSTDGKAVKIKTPRNGIKPHIQISGNLSAKGMVNNFEVHITNLCGTQIEAGKTIIIIKAGYSGNVSECITGLVSNVYTASPGPDKETVIFCMTANFKGWLEKDVNIKLEKGFALKDAIKEISDALEFNEAQIDAEIGEKTCDAPFEHNGKAREVCAELKNLFPGILIFVDNNFLKVCAEDKEAASPVIHKLNILTQAPQFSGSAVSLVAPFNPRVKCLDYVQFPTSFYSTQLGEKSFNLARVDSMQFSFATDTDENQMTITGTAVSALKGE